MEKRLICGFNTIMIVFLGVIALMSLACMVVTGHSVQIWWAICAAALLFGLGRLLYRLPDRGVLPMLGGLFLVGVLLRLLWIFTVPTVAQSDYKTMLDAASAFACGENDVFAQGSYFHRFPHLTFYVVTLGWLFRWFGASLWLVKGCNVVCSSVCILLAFFIGNELSDKRLGLLFALLTAIFPPLICYTSVAATELFAMPFLFLSLLFLIRAYHRSALQQKLLYCALSGLLLSVGSLYRMVGPLYLAAYCLSVLIIFAKGCKWKSILALLLAYFSLFYAVSGLLVATKTTPYHLNDGATPFSLFLLIGFNPESGGMFNTEDHQLYFDYADDPDALKQEIQTRLTDRITTQPLRLIPFFFHKTFVLWGDGDFAANYWAYDQGVPGTSDTKPGLMSVYAFGRIFYLVLLAFCLIALIRYRKSAPVLLLSLMVLGFEGAYMLLEVQPRYTFSIAYIFAFLAAIGMVSLFPTAQETAPQITSDAHDPA